jgi:hypothetical protein
MQVMAMMNNGIYVRRAAVRLPEDCQISLNGMRERGRPASGWRRIKSTNNDDVSTIEDI